MLLLKRKILIIQDIMGILFSRVMEKLFGNIQSRISMVGLDAAGKTTILYKLKLGENVSTIPTIGFNVEEIVFQNLNMTVWDIGGQKVIRYNIYLYLYSGWLRLFIIHVIMPYIMKFHKLIQFNSVAL